MATKNALRKLDTCASFVLVVFLVERQFRFEGLDKALAFVELFLDTVQVLSETENRKISKLIDR